MRSKTRLLALGLSSLTALAVSGAAFAQGSEQTRTFTVPAQPLDTAVESLAQQANVKIILRDGPASGVTSNAVSGASSVSDALTVMLSGTGLSWHNGGTGVIEIVGSAGETVMQDRTLSAVRIEGAQNGNGAFANLSGFGTGAGANGSSDVTATEGTRSLTANGASIASKLPLTLKETSQTVSVLTYEQIEQQNLFDVKSALGAVPGLTVFTTDGNKPVFISRGFALDTYQVDGGAPLKIPGSGFNSSLPDLSEYDRVEVIRGSAALFGGAGNPGGVVSLQRKRPLDHSQLLVSGQFGSWNFARAEVDVSAPVAFDGKLRFRATAALQDQDFFYRYAHSRRVNAYGIFEADLGPDTLVRFGGSYQSSRDDSPNSEGLPLYLDGSDPRLSRSENYTTLWAFNRENQGEQFIQLDHRFANEWKVNVSVTRRASRSNNLIPGIGGAIDPDGPDVDGKTGVVYGGLSSSESSQRQFSATANLTGDFQLFSRKQSFVVGLDYSRSFLDNFNINNFFDESVNIDPFTYNPVNYPFGTQRPTLSLIGSSVPGGISASYGPSRNTQIAGYVQLLLEPIARLHINGGVRYTTSTDKSVIGFIFPGFIFENAAEQTYKGNLTPSVGLVYDVTKSVSIYANYSDIFNPGGLLLDPDRKILAPQRGRTYEAGVKAAPAGGRLNMSLAYYNTKQSGAPISVDLQDQGSNGTCCYIGGGAILSQGVDFQISGALTNRWQVNAGYSFTSVRYSKEYLDSLKNSVFSYAQTQQPKHQVKIWTTYAVGGKLEGLELGGGLRLDSSRYTGGQICPIDEVTLECSSPPTPFGITEPLRVIADARVAYQLTKRLQMSFVVKNIADIRYYESVSSPVGSNFFGQPRNVTISANLAF